MPQDSAILPGWSLPIGIHANHMDMTKFASTDDAGFLAVCGELRRWIKEIAQATTHDGRNELEGRDERRTGATPGR